MSTHPESRQGVRQSMTRVISVTGPEKKSGGRFCMTTVCASCEELVTLIGRETTIQLLERFGGVSIYVPKRDVDTPVARLIGRDVMRRLAERWPSERVTLPKGNGLVRQKRYSAIQDGRRELSVRQLALKFDTSERNIRRILAQLRKANGAIPSSPARAGRTDLPPSRGSAPRARSGSSFPTATPRRSRD